MSKRNAKKQKVKKSKMQISKPIELNALGKIILNALYEFNGKNNMCIVNNKFYNTSFFHHFASILSEKNVINIHTKNTELISSDPEFIYEIKIDMNINNTENLDKKDLVKAWHTFAAYDLIFHFDWYLWKHFNISKISMDVRNKFIEVINIAITQLSIQQLVYVLYREFKSAEQYCAGFFTADDLGMRLVKGIENYINWVLKNNYEIKQFQRNYYVPDYYLVRFTFDNVLGIGDLGYQMPVQML